MERTPKPRENALDRFAYRVLLRTRGGTGVAVYGHADGTWGFLARPDDVAVSRTAPGRVSFWIACTQCATRFTVCTTVENKRVATPCACTARHERATDRRTLERVFEAPEIDIDFFAASVRDEVVRLGGFGLHGMIRGFLHDYWSTIGRRPDARLWARFYLNTGRSGGLQSRAGPNRAR